MKIKLKRDKKGVSHCLISHKMIFFSDDSQNEYYFNHLQMMEREKNNCPFR